MAMLNNQRVAMEKINVKIHHHCELLSMVETYQSFNGDTYPSIHHGNHHGGQWMISFI